MVLRPVIAGVLTPISRVITPVAKISPFTGVVSLTLELLVGWWEKYDQLDINLTR